MAQADSLRPTRQLSSRRRLSAKAISLRHSERVKANPQCAATVFYKVKVSSLQTAIDGAWIESGNGGRLLRCHSLYFASALLAPAARSRLGASDRQHAMSLDRDFRSSPTHGAARQRTGKDTDGPSIQAALN